MYEISRDLKQRWSSTHTLKTCTSIVIICYGFFYYFLYC